LRIANSVGAVLANRRVLGDVGGGPLVIGAVVCAAIAVVAVFWPKGIAWPLGALAAWTALNLAIRGWRQRARRKRGIKQDA
jgi:cardiolipin synthase